jgi:nitrogenase molybdenum-iron protein NifN
MIDSHKYNAEGRAVVYGEPELVFAISSLCLENGILLPIIGTGSKSKILQKLLVDKTRDLLEKPLFLEEADFKQIRYQSEKKSVNIAIGHSGGKYLTEKVNIPLVRVGFPIHDRVGGQRILSVGYTGTMQLLDRITNTILENKQRHYRKDVYEQYYPGGEKYAL